MSVTEREHADSVHAYLLRRRAGIARTNIAASREQRLRERIDALTDERDQAREEADRLTRLLRLRAPSTLADLTREQRVELIVDLRRRGWSLKQIGDAVGRDHTTVHYWLTKAANGAA